VIVVSGLPDAEEAYRGQEVMFLVKPCEPEDLIALVKAALTVPHRKDVVA
jgi:hypothetical protein